MKKEIILFSILALVVNCSDKSTEPKLSDPTLSFSPETITIANGNQTVVDLAVSDFNIEIFAVSLQITFNPEIVFLNEGNCFSLGDFFGHNAVYFVKVQDNKVYLTVSLLRGDNPIKGSGLIGSFTFTGRAAGSCYLSIESSELKFYDESGNTLEVQDFSLADAMITVN